MLPSLLNLDEVQLTAWLSERGQLAYRAAQIREWIFSRRASSFAEMTNLPKPLREDLAAEFCVLSGTITSHQQADDGTEKLLLRLTDGQTVECVLLRQTKLRRTICISTQVGCGMGCVFCASGLDGVVRNLTAAEIVEQMLQLQRLLPAEERLSHIVVMGMGEPLANVDQLLIALRTAGDEKGLGISARRITISTVGLPQALHRLARENAPYHLAVSLHAPDDELRTQLVPVNKNTGLSAILESADAYFAATGRRLTFEYVLLGGINDAPQQARALANLLRGREALINLIPYNPVAGLPYKTPSRRAVDEFTDILERAEIRVKVRRRKGDRIDAACGQLRRKVESGVSKP
ncbi:MAG: 23S rRNA (adenine(2503)-C(2))-methyltransferase RlmN [Pirellulales bacterium]|nr:23S rRNA (adenine(2503)-C(2))-methyltransferase RlmN [Pirellulales bacterium]